MTILNPATEHATVQPSPGKTYHLGNPTSGAICTSRRTAFVKKYAVNMERFGQIPPEQRCKRCGVVFYGLIKRNAQYSPNKGA